MVSIDIDKTFCGQYASRARHAALAAALFTLGGCAAVDDAGDEKAPDDSAGDIASTEQAVMNAWTNYTSEEYQPVICDGNNAMNGFGSTGKYSDNIRMKCASSPNPNFWARSSSWSIYISDDGANYAGCAPGQFITGFACRGAYCDDVAVQCTQMLSLPSWSAVNCHWVGPFSEENGTSNLFGTGWFAKSVRCTGKYCDNMEFEVCYANGGY